jgi:SAM-dependent methyltransferase
MIQTFTDHGARADALLQERAVSIQDADAVFHNQSPQDGPMHMLPWRVKSFISNQFPLLYHFTNNCLKRRVGESYWDQKLAATWNQRIWPTKSDMIARLTCPEQKILDIACGNGSILKDLKGRGYGNLLMMPIPDATSDIIIASQVLEHVIHRYSFAKEIARVLKPEGKAFIFAPNDCLGPIDEPKHVIKYRANTLCIFGETFRHSSTRHHQ